MRVYYALVRIENAEDQIEFLVIFISVTFLKSFAFIEKLVRAPLGEEAKLKTKSAPTYGLNVGEF